MDQEAPAPRNADPSSWWFVAFLLLMFGALMASHIGMLWVQVNECDRYAILRMQEASDYMNNPLREGKPIDTAMHLPRAEQCKELHVNFDQTANLYLTAILALLSGAGFSTGREMQRKRSDLS